MGWVFPRGAQICAGAAHPCAFRRGLVLVTQAGDPLDQVLEPGTELRLDGSGLVVAWALEPSSVRLFRDRAGRPRRGERSPCGSAPPSSLAG